MLTDAKCKKIAGVLGIQGDVSFDWAEEQGHGKMRPTLREKFAQIAQILQEPE